LKRTKGRVGEKGEKEVSKRAADMGLKRNTGPRAAAMGKKEAVAAITGHIRGNRKNGRINYRKVEIRQKSAPQVRARN